MIKNKQAQLILDSMNNDEFKSALIERLVERDRLFAKIDALEDRHRLSNKSGLFVRAMLEEVLPLIYGDKHTEAHLKIAQIQRRFEFLGPVPDEATRSNHS